MKELIGKWHYYSAGAPSRKPVIFLHGFMGTGREWMPIIEPFSDDILGIAPDLPGQGRTSGDLTQLTFISLARALAAFVEEFCAQQPLLVGYSMGGRIALYTALMYPEVFSGLILESSSPGIEEEQEKQDRRELDGRRAEQLRQLGMEGFLREWYKLPVYDSLKNRPNLIEKIIEKKKVGDADSLAEVIVRLSPGIQPSLWNRLPQWRNPTLLIAGEQDTKFSDIARRMAALMPTADLRIIPDAGHIVHLENQLEFVTALKFFLSAYIL